jgi:hypothetical protein
MKKHNLNEGKEELVRALLLMKYDSKKTLTENQENIKSPLTEDVPGVVTGSAAGGAAVGAGVAAAGLLPGTAAITGVGGTAFSVGTALGASSVTGALALGGAVIGGAAAIAVLPLVYWLVTKDTGANRVKKLFQMCSTESAKIAKLERKINDETIRGLSDNINDAVNYQTLGFMAGTDEESLFSTFSELRNGTASDACALVNKYNQEYGDVWDDLDSDIDAESEWNQIYRPLRDCVEDSLLTLKKNDPCKDKPNTIWNEKTQTCVPSGKGGGKKWKDCSNFPLTKGCKSSKVSEIQSCLGITADGKFGPMTEKTLSSKGYGTSVTQEVYDKIMSNCGKTSNDVTTTTTTIYSPERTEYESDQL